MQQMEIKKYIRLFNRSIKLNIRKMKYFKANLFLECITSFVFVGINVMFWQILYKNSYKIPGWNINSLMVFTAFTELFFGIEYGFFMATGRFWMVIVNGKLDCYLARPIDPRAYLTINNFHIEELFKTIPSFIVLIVFSGAKLNAINMSGGIIICIVSALLLSLIELTIGYSAFKLGRVEAVVELIDSLKEFNKYPLTIMPNVVKAVFTLIFPFIFFSTAPSQISLSLISIRQIVLYLLCGLITGSLWVIINSYCWKKGLNNYESYNG